MLRLTYCLPTYLVPCYVQYLTITEVLQSTSDTQTTATSSASIPRLHGCALHAAVHRFQVIATPPPFLDEHAARCGTTREYFGMSALFLLIHHATSHSGFATTLSLSADAMTRSGQPSILHEEFIILLV